VFWRINLYLIKDKDMVSLTKNQTVSLSKTAKSSLDVLQVGLGWDPVKKKKGFFGSLLGGGDEIDLDASCVLMTADGTDIDTIWFSQLKSRCGGVVHNGDNLTGEGDGDDEQVKIALPKIPEEVKKLVFAVTIHEAEARNQNFGMVSNSFMRIVNNDSDAEVARFDLSEDASMETAMVFGELYRHNAEWKFRAVGQGFAGGLAALAVQHGVNV
jgi:tellurium resistance protein TerD